VVPLPYSSLAAARLRVWYENTAFLVVPVLWEYEIATGLRRAVSMDLITSQEADTALKELFAMELETIPPTPKLHHLALAWAVQLEQNKAYDAHYLALAEQLEAVFWSADRRLVNRARQLDVEWAHWVGEES
jgi:predicted nucleic acid-binding protein